MENKLIKKNRTKIILLGVIGIILITLIIWVAWGNKALELNMYNISASREFEQARLSLLVALRRGELDAVVAVPGDAVGYTMPPDILALSGFSISRGMEFDPTSLDAALLMLGYVKCEMTEAPGQYARPR